MDWVLDVVFNEDHLQAKIKNTVQNLSLIKKFALNLLKQEPVLKAAYAKSVKKRVEILDKRLSYTSSNLISLTSCNILGLSIDHALQLSPPVPG